MKTIFKPCFSLMNPSVSSTYTNEGGGAQHNLLKTPKNQVKQDSLSALSNRTEVHNE